MARRAQPIGGWRRTDSPSARRRSTSCGWAASELMSRPVAKATKSWATAPMTAPASTRRKCRAKVVGEGANLAFTQRARVEYALRGGRINTDAVDNSGGVDLSDHEVNLKILLSPSASINAVPVSDDERNRFLSRRATKSATWCWTIIIVRACPFLGSKRCLDNIEPFLILADQLENAGLLDRDVASFPSRREAMSRAGAGLTRPELAVLTAYAKLALKRALLEAPPCPEGEWTGIRCSLFSGKAARAMPIVCEIICSVAKSP